VQSAGDETPHLSYDTSAQMQCSMVLYFMLDAEISQPADKHPYAAIYCSISAVSRYVPLALNAIVRAVGIWTSCIVKSRFWTPSSHMPSHRARNNFRTPQIHETVDNFIYIQITW
jgi:hypothetical protein